jgi:hypothetical protein
VKLRIERDSRSKIPLSLYQFSQWRCVAADGNIFDLFYADWNFALAFKRR